MAAVRTPAGCFAAARGGLEVTFDVIVETQWGDQVWAVGAAAELGCWDPCKALELRTCAASYPRWSGRAALPGSAAKGLLEYKFVITHSDGSVHWEQGSNRTLARVGGEPAAPAPPRFGEADPAPPASEPDAEEELQEGEDNSTAAEDDSWSESPVSESMFSAASLQPEHSSANLSECLREVPAPRPSRLCAGAHRLGKPWGHCEDSYFFGPRALGVADGVGEMVRFAELGVDAAAYAADLMELAASYLQGPGADFLEDRGPCAAAIAAVAEAEAKAASYGASTVAVLALSPDGASAGVANLGDSGFIHFRRAAWGAMEVLQRSREQEHAWNCPYQLCRVPEQLGRRLKYRDTAGLCAEYELELQPGDLLLMYTDGLTDNLNEYEITNIINTTLEASRGKASSPAIAEALARAAHERSLDPDADTPFFRAARRHRQHQPGGKPDDITVVAAWVEPESEDSDDAGSSDEVRFGRPHQAEAQSCLPSQAKVMQRKATQSLLPVEEGQEAPAKAKGLLHRQATLSMLPGDDSAPEEERPCSEDAHAMERRATQMLPLEH